MGKNHQPDVREYDSSTDSSEEKSSPTAPSRSCQHLKKSVDSSKLRKYLKATGLMLECPQCQKMNACMSTGETLDSSDAVGSFEYDNTLWLCLKCGTQLCGRNKNKHALQHFETPHSDSHALTMNTRSFEIWCYECDNEVQQDSSKNLLDCVEFVKGLAHKSPPGIVGNVENKIVATWETLKPLTSNEDFAPIASNPPPPPPPIPGMAKRIHDPLVLYPNYQNVTTISTVGSSSTVNIKQLNELEQLPRVRGLTNLGNTCFFNAVMQCLAQTPYLLEALKESSEPGEGFTLPGGSFKFKNDEVVNLPPIKGSLAAWGGLTSALAMTLEELQLGGGVFTPSKLFNKLCSKCPQFQGGDQHDSHELLRHLLESVRSEDLKRYQRVILQNLGYKDQDITSVSDDLKQKCKIYGNQAADRILRPDQVFRGFLVSTLTCQECYNVSSRHEYFLDLSLPVSVEKSQPPQMRRKPSPDNPNSFYLHNAPNAAPLSAGSSKAQLKKEQKKERKAKRVAKHQHTKLVQKQMLEELTGAGGDSLIPLGCATREEAGANSAISSATSSSAEQSDADVEDNLIDESEKKIQKPLANATTTSIVDDTNGNNQLSSPAEKRGDSPENMDKDSLDEDENDSGIATSPNNPINSFPPSSNSNSEETNGDSVTDANRSATTNSVLSLGLSEKGANLVKQLTLNDNPLSTPNTPSMNGEIKSTETDDAVTQAVTQLLDKLQVNNEDDPQQQKKAAVSRGKTKRVRTQSYSDWSTTIAPRYQCEDGECSVQSCLNNFTAVELMTGNNKVGCETCTKRLSSDDPKAKTVNTNATKQFLISSPPAVLILHLKRFQLGLRCMFRKLTRPVSFPMILDIAPFCGSKVKNLPNIDRKQKKLLYALYGVVEHSGGMYGGHYTAYVKVRPKLSADDKRWKFIPQGSKAELDQDDEQRKKLEELLAREKAKARDLRMKAANDSDDFSNSCSSTDSTNTSSSASEHEELLQAASTSTNTEPVDQGAAGGIEEASNVQMPLGKWYHVSDSFVREVNESAVLSAQAYLLFYERIY
uniref:ubiquitinyl hydrolase 1 n=1 Tax=Glossina pallidipes TaxID=7398 RepID=A0A1B0ADX6_GLOPL